MTWVVVGKFFSEVPGLDRVVTVDVAVVDGKEALEMVELEGAEEGTLPPDIISDASAQNAMRRFTLSASH